jgi:hypothetical protein
MKRQALWLLAVALSGCGWEHYYGPYELVAPTAILEPVDARTFQLPLDEDSRRELEQLAACQQQDPERDPPCICDFPGLRVGELKMRVDYRLELLAGRQATVMIFLGLAAAPGEQLPGELPGRPEIKVLVEHHHLLQGGGKLEFSLSQQECEQAELNWAVQRYAGCPQQEEMLPGFFTPVVGLVREAGNEEARARAELVFRVAGGE